MLIACLIGLGIMLLSTLGSLWNFRSSNVFSPNRVDRHILAMTGMTIGSFIFVVTLGMMLLSHIGVI